jgi:hypothetical protein
MLLQRALLPANVPHHLKSQPHQASAITSMPWITLQRSSSCLSGWAQPMSDLNKHAGTLQVRPLAGWRTLFKPA